MKGISIVIVSDEADISNRLSKIETWLLSCN